MTVKIRRTIARTLALCAAAAASMTMAVAPAHAAVQVTFYVDGATGNDSNPGTSVAPFKTIDMARRQVASVNANMTGDINVNIAPGDYYLTSTLTFGTPDSGTNGYNVVYQSADGVPGSVHIIGGSLVSGWQRATNTDVADGLPSAVVNNVFKTQLPAGTNFNTLYVNDKRAIMARTKNYTFDPRFPAADGTSSNEYLRTTGGDTYSITYGTDLDANSIQGLVSAQSRSQLDAQMVVWSGYATAGSDWYQETMPIGNVDTSGKRLTVVKDAQHPEVNRTHWTFSGGYRYFLQGNLSFLDVPGEYYLNKTTGWLYYYPATSEVDPSTGVINVPVIRPTMQKAIYFKGASKANLSDLPNPAQQVHNIVLNGLTVKDTEFSNNYVYAWNAYDGYGMQFFPPEATGSTNPSYCEDTDRIEYHVGAITLTDTNHITIKNSRVTNAGMNAIEVFRDNDSLTVTNSKLDHLGMGGIDSDGGYPGIGKYNGNHTISNVLVHDVGQLAGAQPGISFASTGHSTLSHLEIFNSPRRGILFNAGYLRNQTYDGAYNPMTDMYTIGNHVSDVYVHDSEQDSGEDSPIFGWVLMNQDLVYKYTNPHTIDPGPNYYNYFDQIIIDNIGANPSMHDKNTVLGMDFAIGATGLMFSNIKSTNIQSYNMDAYTSHQSYTNVNWNMRDGTPDNTGVNTFDDSKMDYANIGLTSTFPAQFAISRQTLTPPSDVYFSENFEGASIDTTNKWIAEKGTQPQSTVYFAEGPYVGKKSLMIDTTANPNGQLLTRTFTSSLNKFVTMKFFDRRIDLATSDNDPKHLPNSWGRVDDGVTQQALGADGRVSTDYFLVKSGSTTTVTSVPRAFGWHEFKWDYTSGSTVTMSIDGTVVATKPMASFNYLSMGDPEGVGAIDYFDDLYVYGGTAAPPPGNQVQPVAINGTLTADNYSAIHNAQVFAAPAPESGNFVGYFQPGSYLDYYVNVSKAGVYQLTYRIADISPYNGAAQLIVDGVAQKTTTFAPTGGWYNWTNVNDTVTLTAGLHTVRLLVAQNGWNFKSAQLTYLAQAVPGQIKAVDYDAESGAIQTVSSSEGPAVGYLSANNYMDYDVIVAATDTYLLSYRVAVNNSGASVQFLVDGVAQKTTSLPTTGGWDSWATVNDTVSLTAGLHAIRIRVVANGWNFGWFKLASTRQSLPGQIDGPSYSATSSGVQVIPVTDSGTTQGVGWFQNGSYMDYSVNVASAGTYTLSYRVAVNAGYTGLVAFQVDGSTVKSTSLPSTGDWQNWTTVTDTVTLPAGQHTIRLLVSNNGWNLHWFSLQ